MVTFSLRAPERKDWTFVIHTATPTVAEKVTHQLRHRQLYILEPLGDITCIIHRRPGFGGASGLPLWIGGNLALANVPAQAYVRNGNGAWMLPSP
jgi:hypothetical protein